MNIDFVRGVTAHLTAAAVLLIIVIAIVLMMAWGVISAEVGITPLVGIAGVAGGFMWGSEANKQGQKQARADLLQNPQEPPPGP